MEGRPRGVVINVLDWDILVSKFELRSCYYIHFRANTLRKGMNSLITLIMCQKVPLLFFYKNGFDIK